MNKTNGMQRPTVEQLKSELKREMYKRKYIKALRGVVAALIVVAALAVLVATLVLPVLQIYGNSMPPTMFEGDIVVAIKGSEYKRGDIIAFYYNNKVLVKRVIAFAGETVDIDEDGIVYIDDVPLDEPYVKEISLGECDVELPMKVGENRYFVMGDHRSVSIDSRSSAIGCIADSDVIGRIIFRIWPMKRFGTL